MLIETLCPLCQQNLATELMQADTESPLRTIDAYCAHHNVAINVMVAAGAVVHWNCYPVRDEADWERMVTNTQALAPGVMAMAHAEQAAKANPH